MFNNNELNKQIIKISGLIEKTKLLDPDDELKSHLAKYICVLCSGFIENAIYHAFSDIAQNDAPDTITFSYAKNQLYKVQNANSKKIMEITTSFKSEWKEPLGKFLQQNDRASAINYILTDRHNIAHGRDSNITISKLELYFKKSIEVIQFIEKRFTF